MKILLSLNWVSVACLCLSGCVTVIPTRSEPDYQPTYPTDHTAIQALPGAVYVAHGADFLFSDARATRVGDVITVRLEEQTSSSKSAETSLKRETDNEILNPSVLGSLVKGSGSTDIINSLDSASEFVGEAESDQSNSLSGTISVIISEIYPNGLMLVKGEKWLNLNRGEEYIRISGLLRPEDVAADNSVSSMRLADARIAYSGTGELANANQAGWLARFFLNPLFPF